MKNEASSYEHRGASKGPNKFYVILGVIICLCAIAEFILWIVDTSKIHMVNQVIMGSGLLSITAGVLWYLLVRPKSYSAANWGLWITIVACIVLFIIGISSTPSYEELGATYEPLI